MRIIIVYTASKVCYGNPG